MFSGHGLCSSGCAAAAPAAVTKHMLAAKHRTSAYVCCQSAKAGSGHERTTPRLIVSERESGDTVSKNDDHTGECEKNVQHKPTRWIKAKLTKDATQLHL